MIRILIADDHGIVRTGLHTLLAGEADLEIVGQAADGLDVVPLVDRLQPDVLLLDLVMPGQTGLEVLRQLEQRDVATRTVVLSMHADEPYVVEALRLGATGFVLKQASADDIITAVREAAAGRRYLSAPLSELVVESYVRRISNRELDPFETLTDREREVLQLVANGLTNRQVASRLDISVRTVESHRAQAMRKLSLHNQAELIRYALRRGLLSADKQ